MKHDLSINKMVMGMTQTNCYYIHQNGFKEAIVIDPAENGEYIFKKLEGQNLKIAGIFLTHGHFDHIMGANELRELSGAKIYIYDQEKELCESATMNVSADLGRPYTVKADFFLKENADIDLGGMNFKLLATPGHTGGSVCYYFEKEGILFSGDTLFQESIGRTDFPTGKMTDLEKSIRDGLFSLPVETEVYPGHGEPTSIDHERKFNPFFG